MRRSLVALPLAALATIAAVVASSNSGNPEVRAAPLPAESRAAAPSLPAAPAGGAGTATGFEKLGLMSPGGHYRLVLRQYKRDDGTQPAPRPDSMIGPSLARRTIDVKVDEACDPESTAVLASENDRLPWYTIRTVNGRETVEFHQRPGVDLSNVERVQELAGPGAIGGSLSPGGLCASALPLGTPDME